MKDGSPSSLAIPRKRETRVTILKAFLLVLIVSLVAVLVSWRCRGRREVDARVAAIRAAGLPVNWDELEKWLPAVPDAENVALIYTNAFAHLAAKDATGKDGIALPRRAEPLAEHARAAMVAALQTNQVALELIHSASNGLKSRYPLNFQDGLPMLRLPHLKDLKRATDLLAFEALLKAEAGDPVGAAGSVQASFDLARSLESEPVLISQITATRNWNASCLSLERILCRASLRDDTLNQLERSLISADVTNRFVIALIGERALTMELMRLAQEEPRRFVEMINPDGEQEQKPPEVGGTIWRILGLLERDRAFYLRAMETNLIVLSTPPPTSLALSNDLRKICEESDRRCYVLSRLLLPDVSGFEQRDASTRAVLRTALAAVAVERWRLFHEGAIPDSLEALLPSFLSTVPEDPFDRHPLRFKKLSKGYVIYSIGPDFQDDGGKSRPPFESQDSTNRFDITFTVER